MTDIANYIRDTMKGVCFCQEIGNGFKDSVFMPLAEQGRQACESLLADPRASNGVDLLAFS